MLLYYNDYTTAMATSGFKIYFIFVFILLLAACSQEPWPEPSCRVNPVFVSNHQGAGACVVRMNNHLLALKLHNALYDLPMSPSLSNKSAQCAAHNAMWLQTGLNVEVENVVGLQADGTWLFGCKLEAGFDGSEPPFPPNPANEANIQQVEFVKPFTLDLYDWAKPDQFIIVRDAFVAQGNFQKAQQTPLDKAD